MLKNVVQIKKYKIEKNIQTKKVIENVFDSPRSNTLTKLLFEIS